ncbi:MAG: S-layer homology domain-containing protein, partial [Oscillospiraceae bacterium]|nr:S-layer homology domain-containing protein [Oscillospiraceae bacterium]
KIRDVEDAVPYRRILHMKRFLAVVLAVAMVAAFVPAATAATTAQDVVDAINNFAQNTANGNNLTDAPLHAEALTVGNTVEVRGIMIDVSATLTLNIPVGVTVKWQATEFSSIANYTGTLIKITGGGTFEVANGGNISVLGERSAAIIADTGSSKVNVSGNGTVSAAGNGSAAIVVLFGEVSVSGNGTVSADGDGSMAIFASNQSAVNVSGNGTVSTVKGTAISALAYSNATISGGTVSAEDGGKAIDATASDVTIDGPVTMSGTVNADITITTGGTLTVQEGKTLTVETGGTITNEGTIVNNGTINSIIGGITGNEVEGGGTLTFFAPPPPESTETSETPETSEIPYYIYFEPTPPAPPVSDADTPSDWAKAAVEEARTLGLVPEHLDGSWRRWLNRAEFAAFAVLLYEYLDSRTITAWSLFDDTTDVNVEKLAGLSIVKGDGTGNFNPNGNFSREMALTLMYNIMIKLGHYLPSAEPSFSDADDISPWAREAIGALQRAGIIKGDGTRFNAQEIFSREMGVVTMAQILEWVQP